MLMVGAEVRYPPIAADGAQRAAEYLGKLMEDRCRPSS